MIALPRQARDTHRENSKGDAFSYRPRRRVASGWGSSQILAILAGSTRGGRKRRGIARGDRQNLTGRASSDQGATQLAPCSDDTRRLVVRATCAALTTADDTRQHVACCVLLYLVLVRLYVRTYRRLQKIRTKTGGPILILGSGYLTARASSHRHA